jgi:ribonucleotide reductase beta subunit family protein with ferritin-like domain
MNNITEHSDFKLLNDESNPFTVFPILNHVVWDMYKKQVMSFWTVEEVDLAKDKEDWNNKLNDNEREFIKKILAFFAASDGIVSQNLDINFTHELDIKEVKYFYHFQNMMENIHGEMYSVMIDTYITDNDEKMHNLNAINTIPCVKQKADWALKWTKSKDTTLTIRLLAFTIIEGVFFSGAFCAIFWLKKKNVMPGLTLSNEFISRDEGLHTEFGIYLYNKSKQRLDETTVHQIFKEAVDIEKSFICESIPCALIGMNSGLMSNYIEYVADRLCVQLGYDKIFNVTNPFEFMEDIGLEGKTNFFEERVSQYNMSGVGTTIEERQFDLNAEF